MTSTPIPAILAFTRTSSSGRRGTSIVNVSIARTGVSIGSIAWHNPYRQYAFAPKNDVILSNSVLLELRKHVKSMMRAWSKRGPLQTFDKGDYAD